MKNNEQLLLETEIILNSFKKLILIKEATGHLPTWGDIKISILAALVEIEGEKNNDGNGTTD